MKSSDYAPLLAKQLQQLTTSEARLLQLANLDVLEPAIVLVIREHDVPLDVLAEAGFLREFALRNPSLHLGAVEFELKDLFAIKPVFDVLAAGYDSRAVPHFGLAERFVGRGWQHVVERCGLMQRAAALAVG